jgi:hypothetical protein
MSLVGALTEAGIKAAKKTAPFYSAVDEALAAIKRPKGTGAEFYTELTKQAGVKKAELADRKLEQAFKAKGKMTKEEAQQVLKDNPPAKLNERELVEIDDSTRERMLDEKLETSGYDSLREVPYRKIMAWNEEIDADMEKYGDYKTAGGQNYREILLKLPKSDTKNGDKNYWSTHFLQDPNVLAHMRVQDRKGANGEKILHVEEIQSDWHQEGRKKGYKPDDYVQQSNAIDKEFDELLTKRTELQVQAVKAKYIGGGEGAQALTDEANSMTPKLMQLQEQRDKLRDVINYGVPDAPFKKNWHELAMKRLLNYAADNGYDSIAITPGAEQVNRFGLEKHIEKLHYNADIKRLRAFNHSGREVLSKDMTPEELSKNIGEELANKLLQQPSEFGVHTLADQDIKVGGEGMKGFYDKILPDYLNTFGKPYGAQVGQLDAVMSNPTPEQVRQFHGLGILRYDIKTPEEKEALKQKMLQSQVSLHNFPITPEMRESIKQKGLPLYQQVGIPTAGAGAASQAIQPEEELGLSGGGIINSAIKQAHLAKLAKMRQEMTPRAEAVKALIARDENRYLADVVPNSLTNAEIESEIKRMAAKARASESDANLAKFLEESKVKDRMYHATNADFKSFRPSHRGAQFVTPDRDFANEHIGDDGWTGAKMDFQEGANIMPVHVQVKNPFDYEKLQDVKSLFRQAKKDSVNLDRDWKQGILEGNWDSLENEKLMRSIKKLGHDAMYVTERDSSGEPIKNLGIFDSNKIKSATGNRGTYDVNESDITKAKGGKVRMTTNRDTMFMELSNKKLKRK